MSYENPITVVDTESAKIRAAGMAGFSQGIARGITAVGQGQREAAKERKKANLKEADDFTKYNDTYQQNIWSSADAYKEATGLDVSSEATTILNDWATKGAMLKAKRDRSDDPAERAKLGKEIAVYDKYLLGGGMGNSFSAISELQATIQKDGAPNKLGRVGGLSASSLDPDVYKDFLRLGQGGNKMTLTGIDSVYDEATDSYSPLGLLTNFKGGGTYSSDQMSKGELVYVPDMQEGVQEKLKLDGLFTDQNRIDPNSKQFIDNFAKKGENNELIYTTRTDVDGNIIKYIDIDFKKFSENLRGTYDASIAGYSAGAGDETSMGFREMQAYVDDILDDLDESQQKEFLELTGFGVDDLKLVSATGDYAQADTILSKESYENYQKALAAKKYLEVKDKVPGTIQTNKKLTQTEINARKKAQKEQNIDTELTNVIQSAITGADTSDEGLYNYLMDSTNANNLGYEGVLDKSFRNILRPIEDAEKYLEEMDKKVFLQATGVNIDDDENGEIKKQEIDRRIKELKDSGNKFFSLAPQDIMQPLEEADAFNRLIQNIPMFQSLSNRTLSNRKGTLDKKERDRKKSPPYQAEKKLKTLGTLKDYTKKLEGAGGKWLNSKATTEAEIHEEYLEKVDAMTKGLSKEEKDILLKKLGIKK